MSLVAGSGVIMQDCCRAGQRSLSKKSTQFQDEFPELAVAGGSPVVAGSSQAAAGVSHAEESGAAAQQQQLKKQQQQQKEEKESREAQYGPGPSLRPQSEYLFFSWHSSALK